MATKKTQNKILSKILFEQENPIPPSITDPIEMPKDISLDQKVDRYLISYEKESVPTANDYGLPVNASNESMEAPNSAASIIGAPLPPTRRMGESRANRGKTVGLLERFIFEAEGDEPAADPGADAGGGEMGGLGGEAPTAAPSEAPVINTPKINLNNFAIGVSRLIQNYETLLNPKATILNRAIEYIKVNYDEPTSKMFKEMMDDVYDMRAEEPQRDNSVAPLAVGAAAEGGASTVASE